MKNSWIENRIRAEYEKFKNTTVDFAKTAALKIEAELQRQEEPPVNDINDFTPKEIKSANEVRNVIIKNGTQEQKAIYMAGEICMWQELKLKKYKQA